MLDRVVDTANEGMKRILLNKLLSRRQSLEPGAFIFVVLAERQLLSENRRVDHADAEDDYVADVTKDRIANVRIELRCKLMREGQMQSILAGL